MSVESPLVSVVIPAYYSARTIGATLTSLFAQTYSNYEVVVVDSSANDVTAQLVSTRFPQVRFAYHPQRLMPYAARKCGIAMARGDLLAFTDPDSYIPSTWLEELVKAYQKLNAPIVGSITSHGTSWREVGIHLAKFDKWLPGGKIRPIDIGPTFNLLVSRTDLEQAGEVDDGYMVSDTLLSWRLRQQGLTLWFVPSIELQHHHTDTWQKLLFEMYDRGREFGSLRVKENHWTASRVLFFLLVSVLPFRIIKIMSRVFVNAWQAGQTVNFILTIPIVLTAHQSRLWGETSAFLNHLLTTWLSKS